LSKAKRITPTNSPEIDVERGFVFLRPIEFGVVNEVTADFIGPGPDGTSQPNDTMLV
jgi:hypothetical protein